MTKELKKESRLTSQHKPKTSAEREEEKKYKEWMEYVQSRGATDDLAIAEDEFERAVASRNDWETDKVWTGPSIPEEYLRELKANKDLKKSVEAFTPEPDTSDFPPFILLPVPDEPPIPPEPEERTEGKP